MYTLATLPRCFNVSCLVKKQLILLLLPNGFCLISGSPFTSQKTLFFSDRIVHTTPGCKEEIEFENSIENSKQ